MFIDHRSFLPLIVGADCLAVSLFSPAAVSTHPLFSCRRRRTSLCRNCTHRVPKIREPQIWVPNPFAISDQWPNGSDLHTNIRLRIRTNMSTPDSFGHGFRLVQQGSARRQLRARTQSEHLSTFSVHPAKSLGLDCSTCWPLPRVCTLDRALPHPSMVSRLLGATPDSVQQD